MVADTNLLSVAMTEGRCFVSFFQLISTELVPQAKPDQLVGCIPIDRRQFFRRHNQHVGAPSRTNRGCLDTSAQLPLNLH